jgi:hypothetical protein
MAAAKPLALPITRRLASHENLLGWLIKREEKEATN